MRMQQRSTVIPMTKQARPGVAGQVSLQSSALAYARNGWRVFPLYASDAEGHCGCGQTDCPGAGSHPRTPNGVRDATTAEHIIARWWRQEPAANIGIATGHGLLVIEVDPQRGGSLEQLQDLYALPETALARTGEGCWHLYYAYANTLVLPHSIERLGEGIEIYADGDYVIAPPGKHTNGKRYTWLNALAPAPLPIVLLPALLSSRPLNIAQELQGPVDEPQELVAGPPPKRQPVQPPSLLERAIQRTPAELVTVGEQRVEALTCLASALYEQGASDDVLKIALIAFNRIQCQPPLPREEVRRVVALYATGRDW
jgi:hypothetical protein